MDSKEVTMSLYSYDTTLCAHEGNKCKKKEKCLRYVMKPKETEYAWYGEFWRDFGKECDYYIPLERTADKGSAVSQLDTLTTMCTLPEPSA